MFSRLAVQNLKGVVNIFNPLTPNYLNTSFSTHDAFKDTQSLMELWEYWE